MPTGVDNLGPNGQPLSFSQYEPGSHLAASGYDMRSDINDERERQRQAAAAQGQAPAPAPAQGQAAKTGPFGLWGGRSRRSRRSRKSKRSKRSKSRRR